MWIKKALWVRQLISRLKGLGALRLKVSHSTLIRSSIIFLILLIAFTVRLLPIRWGFYLNEFDPYFQYRLTKYIVDNGLFSWTSWRDFMSWYPWGRDVAHTAFPGLALTAATFYTIVKALGIPLVQAPTLDPLLSDPVYNLCVIFPVFMGTITCLIIYFLGKDVGGEAVGLFSAFFLALDASYIGRTCLGFFDDESIGILGILLFILSFLRSIDEKRSQKEGLIYAIASGLSLGYLCASWGASRYPILMTAAFVFILILMNRYSSRLFLAYGITFGLALFISINVPYLGTSFIREFTLFPVYGIFLLMCLFEINRRIKSLKKKLIFLSAFIGLCAAIFAFLWMKGYINFLEAKFLAVLNPVLRTAPLVESVAEHRPSAWGTFYYNFGAGMFFLPIGLLFATRMATNRSIFLIVYGLTSIYFASSMIRLTIIMAPVICILWALAIVRLASPFIVFLKEAPSISRRKISIRPHLGREFSGGVLILIFLLLALTFVIGTDFVRGLNARGPRVFVQAYTPTTVAAASMPIQPDSPVMDWINALRWMRVELPPSPNRPGEPGTVVASWWDYGYWITTIANKTTLADNATYNWTQIEKIALMFMSPEEEAIKILKGYNVTHVVVFTTVDTSGTDYPWGEAGKFKWMIQIAHLNESQFGEDVYSETGEYQGWQWSTYGMNTTLYKMMTYGKMAKGLSVGTYVSLDHFNLVYYSNGSAVNGVYALILIYEVRY